MGAAFTGLTGSGMNPCAGDDVIKELNAVFEDIGDPMNPNERYLYARQNNIFDTVKTATKPYRALVAAYSEAGVDVCARWAAYLRRNLSDQDIRDIAQTRYDALTANPPVPISTSKHPSSGGGLKTHEGTSKADPSTIDAPEP